MYIYINTYIHIYIYIHATHTYKPIFIRTYTHTYTAEHGIQRNRSNFSVCESTKNSIDRYILYSYIYQLESLLIYVWKHLHIHLHVHICKYAHTHIYVYMYTCIHICICIYSNMYSYIYSCIYSYIYLYIRLDLVPRSAAELIYFSNHVTFTVNIPTDRIVLNTGRNELTSSFIMQSHGRLPDNEEIYVYGLLKTSFVEDLGGKYFISSCTINFDANAVLKHCSKSQSGV